MKKLLITHHRQQSTRIMTHINAHNNLPFARSDGNETEFFEKKYGGSLQEKMDWLESERAKGREYTQKIMINYLDQGSYSNNIKWIKEFYKDWDIIVAYRKDSWKSLVSYLFQESIDWSLTTPKSDVQMKYLETADSFVADYIEVAHVMEMYEKLQALTIGRPIHPDDSETEAELCKALGVDYNPDLYQISKINIDYEKYIENLDEVIYWYENFRS